MRHPPLDAAWPVSWKDAYVYDCEEVFGQLSNYGYAYAYQLRRKIALDLIEEVIPKGASVLDIAAAQGNFTLALAEKGYRVTWNDLRADLLGYVKLKHEVGDVAFSPGNAFDLDFPELFDCVLITEIIEHVAHPDEFLRKIGALVKPGGYIVMTTPNGRYFRNPLPRFSECKDPSVYEAVQFKPNSDGHIFLLWPDEIARLAAESGLELERMQHFTSILTSGSIKTHHLLPYLPRAVVMACEQMCSRMPRTLRELCMLQTGARMRVGRR